MNLSDHRKLVVLLHGVGSHGGDLRPLGAAWQGRLSDVDFESPDAPFSFDLAPQGYQWFSVDGVTPENRPSRVVEARHAFDRTLRAAVEKYSLSDRLDRVAFVGFSQGSIMALDALVSGRWPVAGIVAFSGRLASPEPMALSPSTRALLIHGDEDAVIPYDETVRATATLERLGVPVESRILSGVGHTISPEGASRAAAFLKDLWP